MQCVIGTAATFCRRIRRADSSAWSICPPTAWRAPRLAPAPYHLDTIHGANKVYVSSATEPVIWVIDQKTVKLLGTIKLPAGEGHQMAVVK